MYNSTQIEIQRRINQDPSCLQDLRDYLIRQNPTWTLEVNPSREYRLNNYKIATLKNDTLALVIYVETNGKLIIEPVVRSNTCDSFGLGFRVSEPICIGWNYEVKGMGIAINRRIKKWIMDVSEFKTQQQQAESDWIVISAHKQNFIAALELNNKVEDTIVLPDIGEIFFTVEGVKLGSTFAAISWEVAAQTVKAIKGCQ